MIKISAHIQKKLPLPGHAYSSQSFSAGLEVEASDADSAAAIKQRVQDLYAVLEEAVNGQIDAASSSSGNGATNGHQPPTRGAAPPAPRTNTAGHAGPNGNGQTRQAYKRGQRVPATNAQKNAIANICADRGLELTEVLAEWNGDLERLSIKEASNVIDTLKKGA